MTEYEYKSEMARLARKYAQAVGRDLEDVREDLVRMMLALVEIQK